MGLALVLGFVLFSGTTAAQDAGGPQGVGWADGYVSVLFDVLPDVSDTEGQQPVTELRARLYAERNHDFGDSLRVRLAGYLDTLVADREALGSNGLSRDAIVRPSDLYVELRKARFDVRAGVSRVVWGRLDEFQPSDVVNPIDLTRFLLEGRSEARLPVGLVRGRLFLPAGLMVEAVVVPVFRQGRFDQLDEPTSPFNIGSPVQAVQQDVCGAATPPGCGLFRVVEDTPDTRWRNVQGGARLTGTFGRVDVGASVYRGLEAFPSYVLAPPAPRFAIFPPDPFGRLLVTFPRFTMVAGDFETAHGPWGVRGEVAYFPEDTLQSFVPLTTRSGRSLDVGFGADRKAGQYRISGNVVVTRHRVDRTEPVQGPLITDGELAELEDTNVLVVGSAERAFARETRVVRAFAAYNPNADSAFVRGIAAFNVRDNVWLEASVGWLRGDGIDTLSRLSMRDFLYTRLRVHF